ncbi:MAG: hypothetical protein BWX84_01742 [Verrucomicrobia bacterium ADurb.Bin118]|nr:MAG: hypothetical protein BWX84_01742 [Verrucomicrobia bacterium ADurb.Bin118]
MRNVATFAGLAEAVALDRFGQDHGGLSLVGEGGGVGGVNLQRVMPAAGELADLFVGQVVDQLQQFRVFPEEMLAGVAAGFDGVLLVITIHGFFHALEQQAGSVPGQQVIPIGAPNDLDDIPARAGKYRFQFLNDFAVAAHGSVEALQVAVHHPEQIVQPLPRGEGQGAQGFRFIGFAVANETDHLDLRALDQSAVAQVAIKPRLVDREQRSQPHGNCGELPEIRHEIRMRIRRQPATLGQFLPEIPQELLAQTALQKRARIHARRRVALKINQVARVIVGATAQKMVERNLQQGGAGGETGNVPAHVGLAVGLHHHRHGVPSHETFNAPLQLAVARERRLLVGGNGVQVGRADGTESALARGNQPSGQALQKPAGDLRPAAFERELQHGVHRFIPMLRAAGGRRRRRRLCFV